MKIIKKKTVEDLSTNQLFEFIDDVLSGYEDWMHDEDGFNCSMSRKYLSIIKKRYETNKNI